MLLLTWERLYSYTVPFWTPPGPQDPAKRGAQRCFFLVWTACAACCSICVRTLIYESTWSTAISVFSENTNTVYCWCWDVFLFFILFSGSSASGCFEDCWCWGGKSQGAINHSFLMRPRLQVWIRRLSRINLVGTCAFRKRHNWRERMKRLSRLRQGWFVLPATTCLLLVAWPCRAIREKQQPMPTGWRNGRKRCFLAKCCRMHRQPIVMWWECRCLQRLSKWN